MRRQLDEKGSALLQEDVRKAGLSLSVGATVEEILGEAGVVSGVRLAGDKVIPADLALLSAGVRPNTRLAETAGIRVDRFILADAHMETSAEGIYACGDCAAFDGQSFAIWAQASEMGRVAGINAVGDEAIYTPVIPSNAFNGLGISLFSVGDNGGNKEKQYKTLEIHDAAKGVYEKLYFVNNRFSGGILMGDVSKSAALLEAYRNGDPLEKLL
jgi:NAD(P)H-nitrite reductase large subunit